MTETSAAIVAGAHSAELNTAELNAAGLQFFPCDKPLGSVLLLHGAGAPVQSVFFQELISALQANGLQCYAANFAYMQLTLQGQRKVAPKAAKLLPELATFVALVRAQQQVAGKAALPLWLLGKSMGGRVASLYLAAPDADLTGIVGALVLGYPLCPPAKAKDALKQQAASLERSSHFSQLRRPLFIAQGSRDAFGSPAQLAAYVPASGGVTLLAQPGADHDFAVRKQDPFSRTELFAQICRQINWQQGEQHG